eukprot:365958-Chlamydomonas_euryale.AAC.3
MRDLRACAKLPAGCRYMLGRAAASAGTRGGGRQRIWSLQEAGAASLFESLVRLFDLQRPGVGGTCGSAVAAGGSTAQQPVAVQHSSQWQYRTAASGSTAQQPVAVQNSSQWQYSTAASGTQQPVAVQHSSQWQYRTADAAGVWNASLLLYMRCACQAPQKRCCLLTFSHFELHDNDHVDVHTPLLTLQSPMPAPAQSWLEEKAYNRQLEEKLKDQALYEIEVWTDPWRYMLARSGVQYPLFGAACSLRARAKMHAPCTRVHVWQGEAVQDPTPASPEVVVHPSAAEVPRLECIVGSV